MIEAATRTAPSGGGRSARPGGSPAFFAPSRACVRAAWLSAANGQQMASKLPANWRAVSHFQRAGGIIPRLEGLKKPYSSRKKWGFLARIGQTLEIGFIAWPRGNARTLAGGHHCPPFIASEKKTGKPPHKPTRARAQERARGAARAGGRAASAASGDARRESGEARSGLCTRRPRRRCGARERTPCPPL